MSNRIEYGGLFYVPVQWTDRGFDTLGLTERETDLVQMYWDRDAFVVQSDGSLRCPDNYILKPGDYLLVNATSYQPVSAIEFETIVDCVA